MRRRRHRLFDAKMTLGDLRARWIGNSFGSRNVKKAFQCKASRRPPTLKVSNTVKLRSKQLVRQRENVATIEDVA